MHRRHWNTLASASLSLCAACSFGVDLTSFFSGAPASSGADAGARDAGDAGAFGDGSAVADAEPMGTVRVTPSTATLEPGASLQVMAQALPPQALTWSVQEGAGGGKVDAQGLYTAPYAAGAFHVLATGSDGARGTLTVTVLPSIQLVAGRTDGYVDGPGKDARFRFPSGSAVDAAGNVYISERINHTIRKITAAGMVSTFAGKAGTPGSDDGDAMAARFNLPNGVAVDAAGNVYVTDLNNLTIRKITATGVVSTLAGKAGQPGALDGTGAAARFTSPSAIAVDSTGNVYVADYGTIRKVSPAGMVSTVAGTLGVIGSADGTGAAAQFYFPDGLTCDAAGSVYIADMRNHAIRKLATGGVVTTVAGFAGAAGLVDGAGAAARFYLPSSVAVDAAGTLYVTDLGYHLIRRISPEGVVSTLAGAIGRAQVDGANAGFRGPYRISVDAQGALYVAEYEGQAVRKISPGGITSTLAGLPVFGDDDGSGSAASFRGIAGIALDSLGNAYVSDSSAIRKITPAGVVNTWAGAKATVGSSNGVGAAARFWNLQALAIDRADNVYIADGSNYTIRKAAPDATVTTLAGLAGNAGGSDGIGANARFEFPAGIDVDAAGVVYVADYLGHTIRTVTPGGKVSTIAGQYHTAGNADGTFAMARFQHPHALTVDGAGSVFVADSYNHTVRKLDGSGAVSTVGGVAGVASYVDGAASLFYFPWAMAADRMGNVFIGENGNRAIRRLEATGVSTVAGFPGHYYTELGALPGSLTEVTGVAVAGPGTLWVTTPFAVYRIVGGYH
jgi:sugar lactone lactonase YvrE